MIATTVLVLDGGQRSALAITRALGSRGVRVITAESSALSLSGASRYSAETAIYAPPASDIDGFLRSLVEIIAAHDVDVVMPATDITTNTLVVHRSSLPPQVKLVLPDAVSYERLTDKFQLVEICRELNIPAPISRKVDPLAESPPDTTEPYPLVIKPTRSKYQEGNSWLSTSVCVAASAAEHEAALEQKVWLKSHPYMLQEYIEGEGRGIFALYEQGRAICFFAHRRLREKPPTGGVSVLSESISPDPLMLEFAQRILDHVKWHGVAMVEFKVAPDGTPYVMEVNTRFWGSLQLAIDSGVDFPTRLLQIALDAREEAQTDYRVGRRLRWLLGDLDSLYLSLKSGSNSLSRKLLIALQFALPHFATTRHEVFRWRDAGPALYELRHYIASLTRSGD